MNKNIYRHDTYQQVLEAFVQTQKDQGLKYTYQQLAQDLNIQKSYLSKVLKGDAHLSADQLYLFAKLLKLNANAQHYLELLLEHARTALDERKRKLAVELANIKRGQLTSERVLEVKSYQDTDLQRYYANAWNSIVHVALTIERFQAKPQELRKALGLSEALFLEILKTLEHLDLIQWKGSRLKILQSSLHLSKASPYFWAWRTQAMLKGLNKAQEKSSSESGYNLSVFFSADPVVRDKVQQLLLDTLEKIEKLVQKAPEEELYQLNFDLIPWIEKN